MNSRHDDNWTPSLMAVSSADGVTPVPVEADPNTGELLTKTSLGGQLVTESYDYIGFGYPDSTTETYTYKDGGSSGTTVATVTVVYTDNTKANITSVTKV